MLLVLESSSPHSSAIQAVTGSLVSLTSAGGSRHELVTHELHKREMYASLQDCSVVLSFFRERCFRGGSVAGLAKRTSGKV